MECLKFLGGHINTSQQGFVKELGVLKYLAKLGGDYFNPIYSGGTIKVVMQPQLLTASFEL